MVTFPAHIMLLAMYPAAHVTLVHVPPVIVMVRPVMIAADVVLNPAHVTSDVASVNVLAKQDKVPVSVGADVRVSVHNPVAVMLFHCIDALGVFSVAEAPRYRVLPVVVMVPLEYSNVPVR